MPQLGFTLIALPGESDEGTPYVQVEVRPLLDGRSFFTGTHYLFDAVGILAIGVQNAQTDIFTCGCGVAGCAGIHEDCELTVDETTMTWRFPAEPFEEKFAHPELTTVRFDRAQYADALASLEAELEALRIEHKLPLLVAPCEPADARDLERGNQPFSDYLAQTRERTRQWLLWVSEQKDADLVDVD